MKTVFRCRFLHGKVVEYQRCRFDFNSEANLFHFGESQRFGLVLFYLFLLVKNHQEKEKMKYFPMETVIWGSLWHYLTKSKLRYVYSWSSTLIAQSVWGLDSFIAKETIFFGFPSHFTKPGRNKIELFIRWPSFSTFCRCWSFYSFTLSSTSI